MDVFAALLVFATLVIGSRVRPQYRSTLAPLQWLALLEALALLTLR